MAVIKNNDISLQFSGVSVDDKLTDYDPSPAKPADGDDPQSQTITVEVIFDSIDRHYFESVCAWITRYYANLATTLLYHGNALIEVSKRDK